MPHPDILLLASGNPHKIAEMQHALTPFGMQIVSPRVLGLDAEVEEDEETLEGNALKKARFWFKATGLPSLADDTGLEVPALGGAPGVRSARYAGEQATDEENLVKLLHELENQTDRRARFRTVMAFADGSETLLEGVCEGTIEESPSGSSGFGYDPVFRPDGSDVTFAAMGMDEKNRLSHRGRAIAAFVKHLGSIKKRSGV